jgi:hypothetical protein
MDALGTTATRLWAVVLLGLVAALLPVMAPSPALADAGLEQAFVTSINAERASAGLSALTPVGDLTTAARRHAQTMAMADHLHHNPDLGRAVRGWQKLGENVGRGPEVGAIHQAFMDSPSHRRNVLDPAFTEVGIGVVVYEGQIWVTEMFRLPTAPAAPSPPAPTEGDPPVSTAPQASAEADPAPAAREPSTDSTGPTAAPTGDGADDAAAAAPQRGEPTGRDDPGRSDARAADPTDAAPRQHDRVLLVQQRVAAHDA